MKRFHVEHSEEKIAGSQRKLDGAFGRGAGDGISSAPVICSEPEKVRVNLPETEKLDDANKVQVYLTAEYKQWFVLIATLEHQQQSRQGRIVLMDFVDAWKQRHPELVAKYDAAIKAAVGEAGGAA